MRYAEQHARRRQHRSLPDQADYCTERECCENFVLHESAQFDETEQSTAKCERLCVCVPLKMRQRLPLARRMTLGEAILRSGQSEARHVRAVGMLITEVSEMQSVVETLLLSNNLVHTFSGIESLTGLISLSATNNCLEHLASLNALGSLPVLQSLALRGNGVCWVPGYRARVVSLCPTLQRLDGKVVGDKSLAKAADSAFRSSWAELAARAERERLSVIHASLRRVHCELISSPCVVDVAWVLTVWRPGSIELEILEDTAKSIAVSAPRRLSDEDVIAKLNVIVNRASLNASAACAVELKPSKPVLRRRRQELWHTLPPQQTDPDEATSRFDVSADSATQRKFSDSGRTALLLQQAGDQGPLARGGQAKLRHVSDAIIMRHCENNALQQSNQHETVAMSEQQPAKVTAFLRSSLESGAIARLRDAADCVKAVVCQAWQWHVEANAYLNQSLDMWDNNRTTCETIGSLQARVRKLRRRNSRMRSAIARLDTLVSDGRRLSCELDARAVKVLDLERGPIAHALEEMQSLRENQLTATRSMKNMLEMGRSKLAQAQTNADIAAARASVAVATLCSVRFEVEAAKLEVTAAVAASEVAQIEARGARCDRARAFVEASEVPLPLRFRHCLLHRTLLRWRHVAHIINASRTRRLSASLFDWHRQVGRAARLGSLVTLRRQRHFRRGLDALRTYGYHPFSSFYAKRLLLSRWHARVLHIQSRRSFVRTARLASAIRDWSKIVEARSMKKLLYFKKRNKMESMIACCRALRALCAMKSAIETKKKNSIMAFNDIRRSRRCLSMWRLGAGLAIVSRHMATSRPALELWCRATKIVGVERQRCSKAYEHYFRSLLAKTTEQWAAATARKRNMAAKRRFASSSAVANRTALRTKLGRELSKRFRELDLTFTFKRKHADRPLIGWRCTAARRAAAKIGILAAVIGAYSKRLALATHVWGSFANVANAEAPPMVHRFKEESLHSRRMPLASDTALQARIFRLGIAADASRTSLRAAESQLSCVGTLYAQTQTDLTSETSALVTLHMASEMYVDDREPETTGSALSRAGATPANRENGESRKRFCKYVAIAIQLGAQKNSFDANLTRIDLGAFYPRRDTLKAALFRLHTNCQIINSNLAALLDNLRRHRATFAVELKDESCSTIYVKRCLAIALRDAKAYTTDVSTMDVISFTTKNS